MPGVVTARSDALDTLDRTWECINTCLLCSLNICCVLGLPQLIGEIILYIVIVPVVFPNMSILIFIQPRPIWKFNRETSTTLANKDSVSYPTSTGYVKLKLKKSSVKNQTQQVPKSAYTIILNNLAF